MSIKEELATSGADIRDGDISDDLIDSSEDSSHELEREEPKALRKPVKFSLGETIGLQNQFTALSSAFGNPGLFVPTPLLPSSAALSNYGNMFSAAFAGLCPSSTAVSVSVGSGTDFTGTNSTVASIVRRPGSVSPGLTCAVCGDISSGKHYGILACNGCSGFFKRSVRRKLIYRCQAGTGSCIVDKTHRNQCQACRLRKCLSQGMNKDAVQNERQPRNTATIRPPPHGIDLSSANERLFRDYAGAVSAAVGIGMFGQRVLAAPHHQLQSFMPNYWSAAAVAGGLVSVAGGEVSPNSATSEAVRDQPLNCSLPATGSYNNNGVAEQKLLISTDPDDEAAQSIHDDSSESGGDESLNLSRTSSLTFERSEKRRRKQTANNNNLTDADANPVSGSVLQLPSPAHESLYETSARLLYMSIKWAKGLPSFSALAFRDQVILLEESWTDLLLLSVFQWSMPMDSCPLLSSSTFQESLKPSDIRYLLELFSRLRSYAVNPAEFACLKAIVLFRSEARGLKDPQQVEFLQDQAQTMLAQHSRLQQPSSLRFGRLLLLLPLLRTVSAEKVELLFFHRTIGSTPMEKILCDMYKQ